MGKLRLLGGLVFMCTLGLSACGGQSSRGLDAQPNTAAPDTAPALSGRPTLPELEAELARLTATADTSARPPGALPRWPYFLELSYDWDAVPTDALPPVVLEWSELLPGDKNFDGRVNAQDLQPVAQYWGRSTGGEFNFYFDDTFLEFYRWDRQLNSDANDLIGWGDTREIAVNFGTELDGYRVYRREVGTSDWQLLPSPQNPASPLTVAHADYTVVTDIEGTRVDAGEYAVPRYRFIDSSPLATACEYRVVPYSVGQSAEGPPSYVGTTQAYSENVMAQQFGFDADELYWGDLKPTYNLETGVYTGEDRFVQGVAAERRMELPYQAALPATVELDYGADGTYETMLEATDYVATATLVFNATGRQELRTRVTEANGRVSFSHFQTLVREGNRPPAAVLKIIGSDQHVPAQYEFNIQTSADPDGDTYTTETILTAPDGTQKELIFGGHQVLHIPGRYTARLTVTDQWGASSIATGEVTVGAAEPAAPGWSSMPIPVTPANRPEYDFTSFSAAAVSGRPALVLREADGYVYTQLPAGAQQWPASIETIPETTNAARMSLELLEVESAPALHANYRPLGGGGGWVGYMRKDVTGTGWPATFSKLYTRSTFNSTIMVVDGLPTAVYETQDGFVLHTAPAATSGSWALTTPELFLTARSSQPPQLLDYLGEATIGIADGSHFARILQPRSPIAKDLRKGQPFAPGMSPSLLVQPVNGSERLLAVYNTGDKTTLMATQPGGFSFSGLGEIPAGSYSVNNRAMTHSFALVDNRLCFAWRSELERCLIVLQAQDEGATQWGAPEVVDANGECGSQVEVLDINGQPGLIYTVYPVIDAFANGVIYPDTGLRPVLRYALRR